MQRGQNSLDKEAKKMEPKMTFHFIRPSEMYSLKGLSELGKFNLVDVRTKAEFDRDHFEGAVSLPVAELTGRTGELDRHKPTLLYCQKGKRCLQAAEVLSHQGFEEILVLDGGLDAYSEYLKGLKK
jgi:rhodanese-related sulfurtransferase